MRFLNKERNQNERDLYSKWWEEQIKLYGAKVDYYVHGYDKNDHDFLYGEHTTAEFEDPVEMVVVSDITNDSIILSKFGISADADITVFIHIKYYEEVFGEGKEPKAGDLIHLKEYGDGRPNGREGPVFEINERDDEVINATNQLMGHYVWVLKGTRYDYSFEKNSKREALSDQVYDNTYSGRLSDCNTPLDNEKQYEGNVDIASASIFNYSENEVSTDVYGEYEMSYSTVSTTNRYWGTDENEQIDLETFSSFKSDKNRNKEFSFTINNANGYIYYGYPSCWGTSSFIVNGFPNTAWVTETITIDDESYILYRSLYPQTGSNINITGIFEDE